MYLKKIVLLMLAVILFPKCTSVDDATRKQDKFSLDKKYALLTFECSDAETGRRITKELRDKLADYGFDIAEQSEFNKMLDKCGLSETEIIKNYTKAVGKVKGVDGLIIGEISLERSGTSSANSIYSSGTGGFSQYVKLCGSRVIDLVTGEILTSVVYSADTQSNLGSTTSPAQIADKIARKLSPH